MGKNILQLAGLGAEDAAVGMANNLEVETALASAMTPRDQERKEHGKRYTLAQLAQLSPGVQWQSWATSLGLTAQENFKGYVVVQNAAFIRQVGSILNSIGLDKIRSYLRFQLVYSYSPFLDERFERVLLKWKTNLYGITALPPRRKKCYFTTKSAMSMHVSRLFVNADFPESSRDSALMMLSEIRQAFKESLEHKTWMDPVTRQSR